MYKVINLYKRGEFTEAEAVKIIHALMLKQELENSGHAPYLRVMDREAIKLMLNREY